MYWSHYTEILVTKTLTTSISDIHIWINCSYIRIQLCICIRGQFHPVFLRCRQQLKISARTQIFVSSMWGYSFVRYGSWRACAGPLAGAALSLAGQKQQVQCTPPTEGAIWQRMSLDELRAHCANAKIDITDNPWMMRARLHAYHYPKRAILALSTAADSSVLAPVASAPSRQPDAGAAMAGVAGAQEVQAEEGHVGLGVGAADAAGLPEELPAPRTPRRCRTASLEREQPARKLRRIRSDLRRRDEEALVESIRPPPSEELEASILCDVCGRCPCICTDKVRQMAALATYQFPGEACRTWLRFEIRNGKPYLGCSICKAWSDKGNPLRGRQSLGRFMLREDNANNHMKDTIDSHVAKASGDHARALDDLKDGCHTQAVGTQRCDSIKITELQENACYSAYTCLKRGLTSDDYKVLAQSAYSIGSQLPDAYKSSSFYSEMTDAAGFVLFKQVLEAVKRSSVFSVAVDEGYRGCNFFALRANYLDANFVPTMAFWQVRKVFLKDHASLCDAVKDSFTKTPDPSNIPSSDMLTEAQFAKGLVGLTADGAPVMGTQRGSRPIYEPHPGPRGNLAYSLLELKRRHCDESLLVAWCCPHRLDLVAKLLENHASTTTILSMIRRLSAHVTHHPSAKSQLSSLHQLFTGEWKGGLDALNHAPHRFLSHAIPTAKVSDSMRDVHAYVYGILARPPDERVKLWAMGMRLELQPLKMHLLLAACADLLGILRKANLRTQRQTLRILDVDGVVEECIGEIEEYVKSDGVLKKALHLLGCAPVEPGSGWRIQRVCRQIQLKRLSQSGALKGVYYFTPTDRHELTLPGNDAVKQADAAIQEVAALVKEDLKARFANTGVLRSLHILRPEWDEQEPLQVELQHAMTAWSKHFGMDVDMLKQQWMGVHTSRKIYLQAEPAARYAPIHVFWPPLLVKHAIAAPQLCHCISSFIVMSWQNAQVERDLAIIKKVNERAQNQLGQSRLDSRVRIELEGPPLNKERGKRVQGSLKTIFQEWAARKRRQQAPTSSGPRGTQGPMPQRAPLRHPGPLVQQSEVRQLDVAVGAGAEQEEEVNIADLLR